jgi:flagellar biogenesis protein FliO
MGDSTSLSLAASSLGSLAVIFAVLIGAALLLRRLRNTSFGRAATVSPITLIATRPLGGQNALLIVEAQGQRFLIGTGRNFMTSLGRLDAHE